MAIKGKNKPRGGTGTPRPVAPKPAVAPRKPPMVQRRWFRRAFAASCALLALFVVLTVMGRTHRTSALKTYDRKLAEAERPFKATIDQTDPKSLVTAPGQLTAGSLTPKLLREYATKWEADIKASADKVRALTPPKELVDANALVASALDEYTATARFYVVAANQRDLQVASKDKAQEKKIGDQVTLLMSHIGEMKTRADALLAQAQAQIDELKRRWGIPVTTPPPAPAGNLPPGNLPAGVPS